MGLIMVGLLSSFLYRSGPMNLSDPSYVFATVLVPLQIVAFFNNRKIMCKDLADSEANEISPGLDRPFPISLVFHTVVTLSCGFMKYQMDARNKDIQAVRDMRKDLADARQVRKSNQEGKKKSNSKKSSRGDNKKKK